VPVLDEALAIFQLVVLQFGRIVPYWIAGVAVGSLIQVFLSPRMAQAASRVGQGRLGLPKTALAAGLGAASPICMYGTVPLIASMARKGVPQYLLAAFMASSVLINPNLFVFSLALGAPLAVVRLLACLASGIAAGLLVRIFFRDRPVFNLARFPEAKHRGAGIPTARDLLASLNRGILGTAPYLLAGIFLTALFDRWFPRDWMDWAFSRNKGLGVVIAASLGVPVYVCGGGTIPLLRSWLGAGMSPGSALGFMISGPATKLTNLGAVKIILGTRNLLLYVAFNLAFAVASGLLLDAVGLRG
jgi:uncharacterized protein